MQNSLRKFKINCWISLPKSKKNEEDNTKIQNALKEVSKGEYIIKGDFSHGLIQWKSLESTGGEDQQFLFLIQESFLTHHVLEPSRGENV